MHEILAEGIIDCGTLPTQPVALAFVDVNNLRAANSWKTRGTQRRGEERSGEERRGEERRGEPGATAMQGATARPCMQWQ